MLCFSQHIGNDIKIRTIGAKDKVFPMLPHLDPFLIGHFFRKGKGIDALDQNIPVRIFGSICQSLVSGIVGDGDPAIDQDIPLFDIASLFHCRRSIAYIKRRDLTIAWCKQIHAAFFFRLRFFGCRHLFFHSDL